MVADSRAQGERMPGRLLRQPPVARRPNPVVLHAIHPLDRPHLHYALTAELTCLYYPTFAAKRAEQRLRVELPPQGSRLGDLETPAFMWMNYLRWRLLRAAAALRDGPLPFAVCAGLAAQARAAAEVRERIVLANVGLAHHMLRLRAAEVADPEEAESRAMCALLRAVDAYDCSYGCRFSTFAGVALQNEITRYQVRGNIDRWKHNAPVRSSVTEQTEAKPDNLDDRIDARAVRRMLSSRKTGLSQAEQTVLRRRFGLNGHGEQTLDQIGLLIGVTKERVRQIQLSALEKLRTTLDPQ